MTRFELANFLNSRLYMLDSEERHRIIDKYIATVNETVMAGVSETDAVAQLGDLQALVNVILARHHINTETVELPEEINADTETTDVAETGSTPDNEKKKSFRDRFTGKKAGKKATNTAHNIVDNIAEKAAVTAASTQTAIKNVAESAGKTAKTATVKSKGMLSRLFSFTADVTFGLINLCLFFILWIPCMLITLLGIVCTGAIITLYMFSGIGFMGVCIAGIGCCIVGVSFTVWLGNILTGGKRKCEEC